MTNYKEEQELELEALTSIFEEGKEFEKISDTEFLLRFKPFPNDEEENHVGLTLKIGYTDTYPETAPDWELQDIVGLPDEKVDALKKKVEESIEESLGMAMIYTVSEMCQDWLKDNNVKMLSMHEEMMQRLGPEEPEDDEDDSENEREVDKLEEEEWKGLKTKVLCDPSERITMASFLEWKKNFDEEMIAAGVLKREESKGKSGKQFFLENQEKPDGGDAKGKTEDLAYNAALFGEGEDDDDDDDLDLDESGDEEKDGGYPA